MRLLKIGRDVSCDIVLYSPKVSSLHAELTLLNNGDIILEDKNSSNGTFVMNQQVTPGSEVKINRGDNVRFADVALNWSQVPMPEDNSRYEAIYGIGVHMNNDIHVVGKTVSRYHATIKVGKDKKVYIIDHSKNGTKVDDRKIPSNVPVQINKNSSVVCGGVPVDLSIVKWPSRPVKFFKLAACFALIFVLCGGGYEIYKYFSTFTPPRLYKTYRNSVVMVRGVYHYEIKAGDLDLSELDINTKYVLNGSGALVPIDNVPLDTIIKYCSYTATGFFVSRDGKLVTNLHVVKPWLFGEGQASLKSLENEFRVYFAKKAANLNNLSMLLGMGSVGLDAYISQIKVVGVLDYVAIVPQGDYFEDENIVRCRVLSAGEDINRDLALIQTKTKRLPTPDCKVINIKDSMDITSKSIEVGNFVYTLGFPFGNIIQNQESESGIQVFGQDGKVNLSANDYTFGINASSYHGASGSPVFNNHGMLVGVVTSGVDASQGFNFAIKARYLKEMLDAALTAK